MGAQWNEAPSGEYPRKLGLLAGTFEDGSLSVYVVPDPEDVRSQSDTIAPTFGGLLVMVLELTRKLTQNSAFTRTPYPH